MKNPEFLDVDDVMALHGVTLDEHGGQSGIRDRGMLESAVATPSATFDGEFLHEDLFAMAAAYAFHIAENQPFIDGNKRAAVGAALVFLDVNDAEIPEATEALYEAMIGFATRRLGKSGLAQLLRDLASKE
ncbi:MAG TPA: type II toxin-antitoxin system death-on-curing family toxin [Polyangiaceae bacterium]|nr:type II toxin-antitoxin system death-on-curing family toxin [Polyangiaceae bacterium]